MLGFLTLARVDVAKARALIATSCLVLLTSYSSRLQAPFTTAL